MDVMRYLCPGKDEKKQVEKYERLKLSACYVESKQLSQNKEFIYFAESKEV